MTDRQQYMKEYFSKNREKWREYRTEWENKKRSSLRAKKSRIQLTPLLRTYAHVKPSNSGTWQQQVKQLLVGAASILDAQK